MNGTICSAFSPNVACTFLCVTLRGLLNEVPMERCTLADFAYPTESLIGQERGLCGPNRVN